MGRHFAGFLYSGNFEERRASPDTKLGTAAATIRAHETPATSGESQPYLLLLPSQGVHEGLPVLDEEKRGLARLSDPSTVAGFLKRGSRRKRIAQITSRFCNSNKHQTQAGNPAASSSPYSLAPPPAPAHLYFRTAVPQPSGKCSRTRRRVRPRPAASPTGSFGAR